MFDGIMVVLIFFLNKIELVIEEKKYMFNIKILCCIEIYI